MLLTVINEKIKNLFIYLNVTIQCTQVTVTNYILEASDFFFLLPSRLLVFLPKYFNGRETQCETKLVLSQELFS